jgi:hypothetical protein
MVFIITAIIMTTYEVIKEFIFEGALTPWQSHTITVIITSTIAVITAYLMRSHILSIYSKEKEIEAKEQSLSSYQLTLAAVNHIVNNVINYLQLVRIDIDENGKLNEETLKLIEESIKEANEQMDILNKIKTPSKPESYKEIYPK